MKILVISGFLGAGKTTFIKELSGRTKNRFVILENEYASINVDEKILKEDPGLTVYESTENCICCTGKADFALDILTISNTLDPEFLVVEPTGVGFLSKVMENIRQVQYERISSLMPLTIVDPATYHDYMRRNKKLFTDHIKNAGTIVLSKCDLIKDRDIIDKTVEEIRELNPDADIIDRDYRSLPAAFFDGLFSGGFTGQAEEAEGEDEESSYEELSILNASLDSVGELVFLLEEIIRFKYGNIVRGKGVIRIRDTAVRVDISGNRYMIEGEEESLKSGFVLIGEDMDTSGLRMQLTCQW